MAVRPPSSERCRANRTRTQDDKESLAELHDYLTGDRYRTGEQYDYQFGGALGSTSNAPGATSPLPDEFAVTTPTTKAERRRSLPSRVSIASFTSEISMIIAPTPTDAVFQQRRRRAAKLTHFFGVDYRDLMGEILDSIEKGLEEERGKGTLKPDEVKVRGASFHVGGLDSPSGPVLRSIIHSH